MPPKPAEDTTPEGALDRGRNYPRSLTSGNGWKPSVWAGVIALVAAANPDASPKKDQTKCISKINYACSPSTPPALKEKFEAYLFVKKYSGIGWDDEDHHATATEEVIKTFLEAHGTKYAKCFKTPCPYYIKLDELYDGMVNKATGEHVVHLGNPKKKHKTKKTSDPSTSLTLTATPNPATAAPNSTTATTTTAAAAGNDDANKENEIMEIDGGEDSAGAGGKGKGRFDDELTLSPRTKASRKRARAISEDNDDDGARSHKREKSDSSSRSGTARRNTEAGTQIARSVDALSDVLAKPVITTEDMSHVDKVVEILKDHTLLPPDPRGQYFRVVSRELAASPALSRILIVEKDHTRRKALLEGILEDAGIIVPTNDDAAAAAVIVPV
ncbi:hypothetical protein B0H14DRAFT_3471855 [Mycena olivaceomarginata]|nr:hypothetical protein B0H14DRAFT_3471855 [Mycena olivaceomarginata]